MKTNYYRKVRTSEGDYVLIYSLGKFDEEGSQEFDYKREKRLEDIKEDERYAFGEEKVKEIMALVINSKKDFYFGEDISWMRYEDYVRFVKWLRLLEPYLPTPIEIEDKFVVMPPVSSDDKTLIEGLYKLLKSTNSIEVMPYVDLTEREAFEPVDIEILKAEIEKAQEEGDYEKAAMFKQKLAIIEAKKDETTYEEKENDIDYDAIERALLNNIDEAVATLDYERVGELRQQLAILEVARKYSNLDYETKKVLFERKIMETEDYVSRAVWMQLSSLLEQSKKKAM